MSLLPSPNDAAPGTVAPSGDLRENVVGGLVQLTQFVSLAVLNIVLPRALGPQGFGLAAAVLALPYAVYALAERPVLNALVRSTWRQTEREADRGSRLTAAARDVASVFSLLAVGVFIWADDLSELLGGADAQAARVASAVFLPMGVNAFFFSLMYAERRAVDALRANLLHGVTLNVASLMFCVVLSLGPTGMVLGLLAAQLACAAYLVHLNRWILPSILVLRGARSSTRREVRLDYAGGFPAPLADVVLGSLLVPIVGALLSLEAAATYKIAMSMVIAGATATPISIPVVQATIARRWLEPQRARRVGRYLLGVGLIAAAFGLAGLLFVYVGGRWFIELFFGRDFPLLLSALKVLILAQVPLVIVRVLTAFFLGSSHPRLLAYLNAGTGVAIVFTVIWVGMNFQSVTAVANATASTLMLGAMVQIVVARRVLGASLGTETEPVPEG